jgi:predicted nucleotidyltransferase
VRHCLQGAELHDAVARVLGRLLDPESHRAWLIGSEATGKALPGSDVDIALEGPGVIDLALLTELRDALETIPTLRSFDLVDLRRTSPRFRREALASSTPLRLREATGSHVEE